MRKKAEIVFNFQWSSSIGKHEENYFSKFNFWRDFDLLPEKVKGHLIEMAEGEKITTSFKKGEIFSYSEENIIEIEKSQFIPQKPLKVFMPLIGRFYPLGFFTGLQGVFSGNIKPVRVIGIDNSRSKLTIDTNVPIAKYNIEMAILIEKIITKSGDIGGECKNWLEVSLQNGPGMQVRYDGVKTDFELENPESFKREDETEDMTFYKEPRITSHIDAKCHENLVNLYSRILPKKGNILDLMSSVQSHLPFDVEYHTMGLGLNEEEMRQNRSLKEYVMHDINKNPELPFNNEEFDIVVCDLSIDYITKPFEVIKEIRRILKPDGIVTFSFSNRYFPPKVIRLWIDLHDYERMGYVLEILLRDGGFKDFHTYSYRGYLRPYGDKYFGSVSFSDPLYVVYAKKA